MLAKIVFQSFFFKIWSTISLIFQGFCFSKIVLQTNLHREKTPQERIEHLTRLHPDYIDVLSVGEIDYKTRLRTDQDFANKFNQMEPRNCSMEYVSHENSVDGVAWLPGSDQFASTSHDVTF